MLTDFVVFAVPRTGSSVVMTALSSHPDIFCHGEIFHPLVEQHIYGQARNALNIDSRSTNPIRFIHDLLSFRESCKIIGFKIFAGHNDTALSYLLKCSSLKKIILQRSNLLASYSSFLLAKETGVWNARGRAPYEAASIVFVPDAFEAYCREIDQTYKRYFEEAARNDDSWLQITYEDHISTSNFTPILDFLEVDPSCHLAVEFRKLNAKRPIDRFSNPNDVIAHLEQANRLDWISEES